MIEAPGNCYENSYLLLYLANRNLGDLRRLLEQPVPEGMAQEEYRAEVRHLLATAEAAERAFDRACCSPRQALLVQGYPIHEKAARPYGHSWVETQDVVIDVTYSLDDPWIGTVREFYARGRIDTEDCRYYDLDSAYGILRRVDHHGPWHRGPAETIGQTPDQRYYSPLDLCVDEAQEVRRPCPSA